NYIDQSKNMFVQMQEQMQQQTRNMFQGFPFQAPSGDAGDREEGKS
ncbi:MAG: polyhydroxyalkanoate synthesis repressor PhaR, partial [Betaproteobacteria bacterium]|nr:polyhydroxyalkanoate synthesis repressor PhaR [Betaproteobacteria bacterium]